VIGWLKISAIILIFSMVMGGYIFVRRQSERIADLTAKNAALKSNLDAAERASRVQTQVRTITQKVYVKAQEGADHVKTIDPACANGAALVGAWRDALHGVRALSAGRTDHDPASAAGAVPQR